MNRGAERPGAADHLGDLCGRARDDAKPERAGKLLDVLGADRGAQLVEQRHRAPRKPILPGFITPSGSRLCLAASKIAIASRCSAAMNGALSRPTPWWWLIVAPTRVAASRPSRQIASYRRSAPARSPACPANVK